MGSWTVSVGVGSTDDDGGGGGIKQPQELLRGLPDRRVRRPGPQPIRLGRQAEELGQRRQHAVGDRPWGRHLGDQPTISLTTARKRRSKGQAVQLVADRRQRTERPPGDGGLALKRALQGVPRQLPHFMEHLIAKAAQGPLVQPVVRHPLNRRGEAHRLTAKLQRPPTYCRDQGIPDQLLPFQGLLPGPGRQRPS